MTLKKYRNIKKKYIKYRKLHKICKNVSEIYFALCLILFTPQPLRAVGVLFSPMVSGWAVGRSVGKVCLACISGTVRCIKLILGRDIC